MAWTVLTAYAAIDRKALVTRNNPIITSVDTLASLSVGNGGFAFTSDITGLQTFPEYYKNGVPLGTQSEWGWHSFDNPEQYRIEESLVTAIASFMPPSPKRDVPRVLQTGIAAIRTVCT